MGVNQATIETDNEAGSKSRKRYVSNKDESCRMFKSDIMEYFSHVHPAAPHVLFVPLISFAIWWSLSSGTTLTMTLAFFALGVLLWTGTEYFVHRYFFHPPPHIEDETREIIARLPENTPIMAEMPTMRHKIYFLVHGVHHDFPNDSRRLVMPPTVSGPLALAFWLLFSATMGPGAPATFAGFVLGYLVYDTIHFLTHHASGKTRLGKFLKRRHFRHHYADSSRDFGVSTPLWDVIMRTYSGR